MTVRKLHRIMGVTLLLPFFAWAITGMIFFIKPGYKDAYALLSLPQSAITEPVEIPQMEDVFEMKVMKTVLGTSLLVNGKNGWQHLDPVSLSPRPEPSEDQIRQLVNSAISQKRARYGQIETVEGTEITTTTGIKINLNWTHLRLSQYGQDTARIDWYYKVHYLQWTGNKKIDNVLGLVGLILVMAMALSGCWLLFRSRTDSQGT